MLNFRLTLTSCAVREWTASLRSNGGVLTLGPVSSPVSLSRNTPSRTGRAMAVNPTNEPARYLPSHAAEKENAANERGRCERTDVPRTSLLCLLFDGVILTL